MTLWEEDEELIQRVQADRCPIAIRSFLNSGERCGPSSGMAEKEKMNYESLADFETRTRFDPAGT